MRTGLVGSAFFAAAIAACGGKVVVDQGAGGAGGVDLTTTSSSGNQQTSTNNGTGGCFFVPPPVGAVHPETCGGSVGAGGQLECTTQCNDDDNHVWEVTCKDKACRCVYDNKTICTCAIEGNVTLCGGGASPCCPPPWIGF